MCCSLEKALYTRSWIDVFELEGVRAFIDANSLKNSIQIDGTHLYVYRCTFIACKKLHGVKLLEGGGGG